jgi:2',3'-cyclic-nucleotide 2'-phosphodiesterase (5'-nucleotidase family)
MTMSDSPLKAIQLMRSFSRTFSWWITFLSFACLLNHARATNTDTDTVTDRNTNTNTNTYNELLSFGEINVMVLTDVHSWVAGHLPHDTTYDADYGDVLSFYEHLQAISHKQKKDLFFVMNGDFIDGTGLSTNPPKYLTPILQQMPWDAITIGNHELYKNSTIDYITEKDGFIDKWDGKYLTSNVVNAETHDPLGERYRFLHAPHSNTTILTFGFLFNFKRNCLMTKVEDVNTVLESLWFSDLLMQQKGKFDAILVLAHMGYDDSLVDDILKRIRTLCGDDMPVQFITGHTHIRAHRQIDHYSSSFEAGKYLDTIGFVSFPTKKVSISISDVSSNQPTESPSTSPSTLPSALPSSLPSVKSFDSLSPTISNQPSGSSSPSTKTKIVNIEFNHTFINTTINTMKNLLGINVLKTENGTKLSDFIAKTEQELGLLEILGCAPITYELYRGIDEINSLWGLFLKEIVPDQLFSLYQDGNNIFMQGVGAMRYKLYEGNVTLDDLTSASPFNDTIYLIDDQVKGEDIIRAFGTPNYVDPESEWELPNKVFAGTDNLIPTVEYKFFTDGFNAEGAYKKLMKETNSIFEPKRLEDLTTGIMWKSFMKNNITWNCDEEEPEPEEPKNQPNDFLASLVDFFEEFTVLKVIAFILTFIIIVFFGWMFVCRSHKRGIFSYSDSESGSELSMMDDLSFDEFSSSETSQHSGIYMPRVTSPQPPPNRSKKNSYHSFHPSDTELI